VRLLLYPLRDLMSLCFWAVSFLGTTIVWRRRRYRLLPGGTIQVLTQPPAAAPRNAPEPVPAVDAHAIANR